MGMRVRDTGAFAQGQHSLIKAGPCHWLARNRMQKDAIIRLGISTLILPQAKHCFRLALGDMACNQAVTDSRRLMILRSGKIRAVNGG